MSIAGWKIKMGVAFEDGWAAPKLVTRQYPFLQESVMAQHEFTPIPEAEALGGYKRDALNRISASGSLAYLLHYLGVDQQTTILYELAFGSGVLAASDCSFYPGVAQPPSATICLDRGDQFSEYPGSVLMNMHITGVPGAPVTVQSTVMAQKEDDNPTVNTDSSGWTAFMSDIAMFEDLTFSINDYDGGAFGAGDERAISAFDVRLEGDWVVHNTVLSGLYISQPKRRSWSVNGGFTLPSSSDFDSLKTALDGKVFQKVLFDFSRTIAGTIYSLKIWLPKVRLQAMETSGEGEGLVSPPVVFAAYQPVTTPAGFPTTDAEIILQITKT